LIKYLKHLHGQGASLSVLQKARSAISTTISIATDGQTQLGDALNVKRFLAGVRQSAPVGPKKLQVPAYHDVSKLYALCWLYGPNEALCDGLLKEKLVTLLMLDGACRPSDIFNLNRTTFGRFAQIKFDAIGMQVRYWWPKEVVPGSSRKNSTNGWFSLWVKISRTVPKALCTVVTMQDFLRRTSDPEIFASRELKQIKLWTQPLVWGQVRQNRLQASSVDHISNLVQDNIDLAGMGKMKTAHIRGASTSKIVDLVPALKPEALALGRWTTEATFDTHYYAPLLEETTAVPEAYHKNPQQILRWGWKPKPPGGISVRDYERGPSFWVGKTFNGAKISSFAGGYYVVPKISGKHGFTHEELMRWIAN